MQNLQLIKDGDYRFRTGTEGDVVQVWVYYTKAHYRGVMVTVTPITLKEGMMSFVLTSGYRIFAQQLPRKTPKAVAAIAAKLDAQVPEIARLYAAGQQAESKALVASLLAQEKAA